MAKDRAYKYGWHPDRPQDAQRQARSGDDVEAPEGSDDGWVTTKGFMEATRIGSAGAGRAARAGAIQAEKRGGRWYIAPDEVETWAAVTKRVTAEMEAEGQGVAGFYFAIDEDLRNVGTRDAPEYRRVGYRASVCAIYSPRAQAVSIQSDDTQPPSRQRTRYVQYRAGLKFTSRRPLTEEELDLRVKHRRATLDRDRSLDEN